MADEADTTTTGTVEEAVAQEVDDQGRINTITKVVEGDASKSAQTDATKADTTDWKAEARKHEQRAKENYAAAQELAKLKKSQMNEQQKAEAAAQEATTRAEAAERRAALAEAAITHGLTKDDLELLDGVPADQIEDRAKKLADRLKKAAPPSRSGGEGGGDRGAKKPTTLEGSIAAAYGR